MFDDNGKQHSSSDERADWVSSVAFWYQNPIAFSDSGIPPAIERIPPYQIMLAANLKFKATPEKIEEEKAGINFVPEQPDGEIEFEFDVKESGRYKFSAVLVDNIFGSSYQPIIDNQPTGPVLDMMSKGGHWREFVFGVFKFEKGKHIFKLHGKGASLNSRPDVPKIYAVGISSFSLLPIESL